MSNQNSSTQELEEFKDACYDVVFAPSEESNQKLFNIISLFLQRNGINSDIFKQIEMFKFLKKQLFLPKDVVNHIINLIDNGGQKAHKIAIEVLSVYFAEHQQSLFRKQDFKEKMMIMAHQLLPASLNQKIEILLDEQKKDYIRSIVLTRDLQENELNMDVAQIPRAVLMREMRELMQKDSQEEKEQFEKTVQQFEKVKEKQLFDVSRDQILRRLIHDKKIFGMSTSWLIGTLKQQIKNNRSFNNFSDFIQDSLNISGSNGFLGSSLINKSTFYTLKETMTAIPQEQEPLEHQTTQQFELAFDNENDFGQHKEKQVQKSNLKTSDETRSGYEHEEMKEKVQIKEKPKNMKKIRNIENTAEILYGSFD